MIYTSNKPTQSVPLTEEYYFSTMKSVIDRPIVEDAYVFLYESDYNYNKIISEINIQEAKAEEMGCTLVLEATDIKAIFRKIKDFIVNAWKSFIEWLKKVKDKIAGLFKRDKNDKTDPKKMQENLDKLNSEEAGSQEIIYIDEDQVKEIENNIVTVIPKVLDNIENAETEEELQKIDENILPAIIGTNVENYQNIGAAMNSAVGLNNKSTVKEVYKKVDDVVKNNDNSAEVQKKIDSIAKSANDAVKKVQASLDKAASEYVEASEEIKKETLKANLYRKAANIALAGSTAVGAAIFTDAKQREKIRVQISQDINNIAENNKAIRKIIDVWNSARPSKNEVSENILKRFIDAAEKDTAAGDGDYIENNTHFIEVMTRRAPNKLYKTPDNFRSDVLHIDNSFRKECENIKYVISGLVDEAKKKGIQINTLSNSEFEEDPLKWDNDYIELLYDLLFKNNKVYNVEAYYHYALVHCVDYIADGLKHDAKSNNRRKSEGGSSYINK